MTDIKWWLEVLSNIRWLNVLPIVISVGAFLVSGLSLLVAYLSYQAQQKARRPRLSISVTEGTILATPAGWPGGPYLAEGITRDHEGKPTGEAVLVLKLINPSEKPVRVRALAVNGEARNGPSGRLDNLAGLRGDKPFPPEIDPVDSVRYWVGFREMTDMMMDMWLIDRSARVTLTFQVSDALDDVYEDTIVVETGEWASA
jgi:hypothetical protein